MVYLDYVAGEYTVHRLGATETEWFMDKEELPGLQAYAESLESSYEIDVEPARDVDTGFWDMRTHEIRVRVDYHGDMEQVSEFISDMAKQGYLAPKVRSSSMIPLFDSDVSKAKEAVKATYQE